MHDGGQNKNDNLQRIYNLQQVPAGVYVCTFSSKKMARHIVCVLDRMVGHVNICWDYVSTFLCNKNVFTFSRKNICFISFYKFLIVHINGTIIYYPDMGSNANAFKCILNTFRKYLHLKFSNEKYLHLKKKCQILFKYFQTHFANSIYSGSD